MASPLKIGFIVNGNTVPAWYAATIRAVVDKGHTVFFVQREEPKDKREKAKKSLLLKAFEAFEERWFRHEHDAAKAVGILQWMNERNVIGVKEHSSNEAIIAWGLDVLYTIDFREDDAQRLSQIAANGLWAVHFYSPNDRQKNLAVFWAVMKNAPVTESSLLIYKGGQRFVVYEGSTRTVPYSVKNNFSSVAWKASSYLPLRLEALQNDRKAFLVNRPIVLLRQNINALPGNAEMFWLWLRNTARYLRYKLTNRFKEARFMLLYANTGFAITGLQTMKFISLRLPNKKTFYADPFVIEKDGTNHVFFEEMDEAKEKAHISLITIRQGKKISEPVVVLEKPYHLSYPFVFMHEAEYYMVPETASNKTVELYKATSFPYRWEHVMNLMDSVELVDATLHFEGGKWWLFAGGANHPFVSSNDQLFLFYNDALFSTQWTPHPQNPVATHAANCRPGGRIFNHKGKLYRPAQNNASQQYGYGLKINEITVLNETAYEEKETLSILPETLGLKACHHLDFSSSIVVIDGIKPE